MGRVLVAAGAILAGALLQSGCGASTKRATPPATSSLGQLAGYDLPTLPVTSASARWQVPRIGSPFGNGVAATWVGIKANGNAKRSFIQVGTSEVSGHNPQSGRVEVFYYAFWSDTQHHFHILRLFAVKPGDRIAAQLKLTHHQWAVEITDASGAERRFFTRDETRDASDQAEWFQEDVTDTALHRPFPYPRRISSVQFGDLRVNGKVPDRDQMVETGMTVDGHDVFPRPISDGFIVGS